MASLQLNAPPFPEIVMSTFLAISAMVRKVIGFIAGPERPEYVPLPKREGYGSNVSISTPNKDGIVLLAVMPSAPPLFTAFATSTMSVT